MAQTDTVERILDAAEVLFAERGFAETSLRTITGTAGVNLAAVNYHFGSKKELIQAVFARFLTPFCAELESAISQLLAEKGGQEASSGNISTEDLMRCLFQTPTLGGIGGNEEKAKVFMRLLGLAYTQSQEHLRRFIVANYGNYYYQFIELLKQAVPCLDTVTFHWRLYFMLGSAMFTLSSFDSFHSILQAHFNENTSMSKAVDYLVPAMSGMFDAPQH